MSTAPIRGQIHLVEIGDYGPKPFVVVSNNVRNRRLGSVLGVRVTTTDKAHVPTAVPLGPNDGLTGYALADVIFELYKDEIEAGKYVGSLSPGTIMALNAALKQALGIAT